MEVRKYFKVNGNENMMYQNLWNAANMGLTGNFMENNQNQKSKHPIKILGKKNSLIKPKVESFLKDSKSNKYKIENQQSHKMVI